MVKKVDAQQNCLQGIKFHSCKPHGCFPKVTGQNPIIQKRQLEQILLPDKEGKDYSAHS